MYWRRELAVHESQMRESYRLALISRARLDEATALYHARIQPLHVIETYLKG
jgi:hypothetical protein